MCIGKNRSVINKETYTEVLVDRHGYIFMSEKKNLSDVIV